MVTKLVMVGTAHIGKKEYRKNLKKILRNEKPDVICVEMGDKKTYFRGIKKYDNLLKDLNKRVDDEIKIHLRKEVPDLEMRKRAYNFIMKGASIVFYDVLIEPEKYAKKNNIPIKYIDSSKILVDLNKEMFNRHITEPAFRKSNIQSKITTIEQAKQMLLSSPEIIIDLIKEELFSDRELEELKKQNYIGLRDEKMKMKIKRVIKEYKDKKILSINGALHLLNDKKNRTLYSKLINDKELKKMIKENELTITRKWIE